MLIYFTFILRRELHMTRSVTNKISCAHIENIDKHSQSLISVFNVHIQAANAKGYQLGLLNDLNEIDTIIQTNLKCLIREMT